MRAAGAAGSCWGGLGVLGARGVNNGHAENNDKNTIRNFTGAGMNEYLLIVVATLT